MTAGSAPVLAVDLGKSKIAMGVLVDGEVVDGLTVPSSPEAFEKLCQEAGRLVAEHRPLVAGLSTFGPLVTDPASSGYGSISPSSMVEWDGFNPAAVLAASVHVPVFFMYDVVAAAAAEKAASDVPGSAYLLSWGSGIGGLEFGDAGKGTARPRQFGHVQIPRLPGDDDFSSTCRFHPSCLQGLAGGMALQRRIDVAGDDASARARALDRAVDRAIDTVTDYVSVGVLNLLASTHVTKVVMVGGVGLAPGFAESVGAKLGRLAGDFDYGFPLDGVVTRGLTGAQGPLIGAGLVARNNDGYPFRGAHGQQ